MVSTNDSFDRDAFFFDFDGVLADSVNVKTEAFVKLFESFGPRIQKKVRDHHLSHGGMTRREKFRHYYSSYLRLPLSDEKLETLCDRFAHLVVDNVVAAPEIPGAKDFLQRCSRRAPCFVISATPEDEIRLIIERRGLAEYFAKVLGAPASKKENLRRILNEYGLKAGRCQFFGDSFSDFAAAETCGVDFMGILEEVKAPLLSVAPRVRWYPNFNVIMADEI